MIRPRALDLFCGAGGVSVGLELAGFEVTGVDHLPMPHYRGGAFVQADALAYPLEGVDFIWASPPCQRYTSLRHLQRGREYPDLIPATRARLVAGGIPWCIENVEGAPLGASGFLIMLCGTMFGLQTPDGRAELRRHRLFELSWPIALRPPACQHGNYGGESLSVCGTGMGPGNRGKEATRRERRDTIAVVRQGASRDGRRRAISVAGNTPQTNTVRNVVRETFTVDDARHAMGIDWMPMKYLSQAIPPAYAEWIGRQAIAAIGGRRVTARHPLATRSPRERRRARSSGAEGSSGPCRRRTSPSTPTATAPRSSGQLPRSSPGRALASSARTPPSATRTTTTSSRPGSARSGPTPAPVRPWRGSQRPGSGQRSASL